MYLCIVSDIEEVEREDVVFGPDHEPSLLLIQQEGVVRRAVGRSFKRHQVVRLQHFCRRKKREAKGWWAEYDDNSDVFVLFPLAVWQNLSFSSERISSLPAFPGPHVRHSIQPVMGYRQWQLGESHAGSLSILKKMKHSVWDTAYWATRFFLPKPSVLTFLFFFFV